MDIKTYLAFIADTTPDDAVAMIEVADGYADDEFVLFRGERFTAGFLRELADDVLDA